MGAVVFSFPFVYFGVMLVLFAVHHSFFWRLLDEDGVLEYFQAFSYAGAGILGAGAAVRVGRAGRKHLRILLLAVACGLFFVSLEEISWGERIFEVETPAFFVAANRQGELNVHNLAGVQEFVHLAYILVGLWCSLGSWFVQRSVSPRRREVLTYLVPGPVTMFYFLPTSVHYIYFEGVLRSLWPDLGGTKPQEMFEAPFALGFFIFMVFNLRRAATEQAG